MAAQISRRGFLIGLSSTTALFACPQIVQAQALPVWTTTPSVTTTGRMVVSSITLNGSTTALSIGDRTILSRAATQVAAKSATRAIANRTMSAIATRMLASAAVAGPWGLAAAALGVVGYGAYRYFTRESEDGAGGASYEVSYGSGANASADARGGWSGSAQACVGLPGGGRYPSSTQAETVPIGIFNNNTNGTCLPAMRVKQVIQCPPAQLAGLTTAPPNWSKAHTYNRGAVQGSSTHNEYWVYYTRVLPSNGTSGYAPVEFPGLGAAEVPQTLPADTTVKAPSRQIVADLANAAWQLGASSSDTSVMPWSSANGATATAIVPSIKPGAETVPDVADGTIGDLIAPRPAVTPNAEVGFTYPDTVVFPDDAGATNPGTNPNPNPTPTPNPTPSPSPSSPTDWGPAPDIEGLPSITPMSWFPTMFEAPNLAGACSGWEIPLPKLGVNIPLNPCPHLNAITPIVRPICAIGATITAGKVLLDI